MKIEYKVIVYSIIGGIFLWMVGGILDFFFFHNGSFFELLIFDTPPHIYIRLVGVISFLIFGMIISKLLVKYRKGEEELKKYRAHLEELVKERTIQLETTNEQLQKAKEKARSAYLELNQIFNATIDGMCVLDKDFRILSVNKRFCTFFGITKDEAIGKKCSIFFNHPICRIGSSALHNKEFFESDTEIENKEGIKIPCILTVVPFRTPDGELIGIVESFRDISERKRAEKALQESETKYRNLIENASDTIFMADEEGNVLGVNKRAEILLGYTKEEMIGMKVSQFHPKEDLERSIAAFKKAVNEGEVLLTNALVLRKDGQTVTVDIKAGVIEYGNKRVIQGIFRDVTERKKMEEELIKVQKLEAIGVLAGGIAHDFNNLLTSVIGNLSLIELYAKSGENIFEVLDETKKASYQTKHLTQQLLTFSKGGDPLKKPVSIAKLLKETVGFVLSGSNVKCHLAISDDLWGAPIDEGQITQVINNLIINADQAMPQGGIIEVNAENVIVKPEEGLPLKEGKYIKISIKDHGIGIPEKYLSKLFDPYFTTKQKGSGLGLSITYSIIQKHEGHITVESKIGSGTTFSIYLPASEKEVFTVQKIEEKGPVSGKGKILWTISKALKI